jgi:ABC-type Mn2+/Zn2+ transport system permease subunit
VLYHRDVLYLLDRLGVPTLGFVEPVPGVPPTARHIQSLVEALKGGRGVVLLTVFQPDQGPQALASALGLALGHALVEGQLYFARGPHLLAAALLFVIAVTVVPLLSRRLARSRLFPIHDLANRLPAWRWHLSFDVLAALAMAVGTATVGLMAAFALVFVPPWIAFRTAPGWRATLAMSVAVGVGAYLVAFAAAAALDQPFGPVLVATLLAFALALYPLLRVGSAPMTAGAGRAPASNAAPAEPPRRDPDDEAP